MEYIIYKKDISKSVLKQKNIVITDDCVVAENTKIWSNVCLKQGTVVADNCEISSNSVLQNVKLGQGSVVKSSFLEDCIVGANCSIGPFAHIRGGATLGDKCRVGNFVEIKNAQIGNESKMAHLAYIGDATVGKNCNIGCGVIFCNYNGKVKQRSVIGDNVFVGSNTNLIAPVNIGDNAYIAGGSTITQNVAAGEFAIARSRQTNKTGFNNPYLDR